MAELSLSGLALPPEVARVLGDFLNAARETFGNELRAAVLFGSAAEGRMRATSDVNLILVLSAFAPARAVALREPLQVAEAAIRLRVMFLVEHEIGDALKAFPVKFADILRRRVVLYGSDPFTSLTIPRRLALMRLKQVLLNQVLRLRTQYVARGGREEQLGLLVAEATGPLRSCAATLRALEGQPVSSGKDALRELVMATFPERDWQNVLDAMSIARDQRLLPAGTAAPTVERLIELTQRLAARTGALTAQLDGAVGNEPV